MRVRFHGRLVDAFVLERRSETDHVGKLGWLDRVVSAEPVLTPEVRRLVDAVAARYAGTRADVLRLAIPPRHANVEKEAAAEPAPLTVAPVDTAGPGPNTAGANSSWPRLREGRAARAVWQALPGERWADRLAEAAAATVEAGRGVLAIVPDQRDVDALRDAGVRLVDETPGGGAFGGTRPRAALPPLAGGAARSAPGWSSAPAVRCSRPVADLGLVMVWDDGDDSLAEPRAPYPHAREVAMLRAHQLRCAALIGGYARTAEAQALVRSRWAHDLVAARPVVRARAPRVIALDDSGYAQERDPAARTARLPSMALRAARSALEARTPRAGPGAAPGLCARAGLRPLPHHRPLQALHRPAVAARPGRRGRGVPLVRPRGTRAALRPMRIRRGPRRRRRRPPHRRRTRPGVSRHHGHHLRRRRRGVRGAGRAGPRRRHPGRRTAWQPAATAPRCCSTAGRCWAARTCAPPRTRCGAGWPPPRWCAAAATAGWWRWSPNRRSRPCRR